MEAVALLVAPTVALLTLPSIGGDGTISGCEARCPANGLFVASIPAFASTLIKADRSLIIAIAFATLGLIGWRVATGTPPRRRAFFIGAPLAVCFELLRAGYHSLFLLSPEPSRLQTYVNWTFALARSTLCYGFLLALVAAELFAGRVLRRLVAELLRRPSLDQLEAMLREPLGDPGLRLGFWDPRTRALVDARGEALTAPEPPSGQVRTVIERDRGRAAVLFHDAQLTDDPELLQAAGTVALLALENLDLEAAWTEALRELQRSRARISAAGDVERRKLERDLHDGAQQRLVAALIKLGEVRGGVDDPAARSELATLVAELERTLLELRELAHGIYPPVLADAGLVPALRATDHTGDLTVIAGSEVGRYGSAIESAVYFCCLEAIQNATKHSGAAADIVIRLSEGAEGLRFDVQDAGPGFDPSTTRPGIGIRNMRDRLEAVGGSLEIVSSLGRGTVVTGTVPLGRFVSDPHPAPRVTEVP
jgi:signal transduction histidine kinase